MDEKKVREEYLEFPWGIEDTIENLRELKNIIQKQVREANCDGKGAQDAFEVGFDFDRAIEALEKQIAKKPVIYKGTNRADCPICGMTVRGIDKPFGDFCSKCGQRLDWSE